MVPEKLL